MTRIVSFDGGGIRGVISLSLLIALEKDARVALSEKVDVFAGTSTGAIIAVCLAMGMSASQILTLYTQNSRALFKSVDPVLDHLLPLRAKYDNASLKALLQRVVLQATGSADGTLGMLNKKVIIPYIDLDDVKLHRWRLGVRENITQAGKDVSIVDAVMESTAAPTYFPSYQGCIDGGIGANDPCLVAYCFLKGKKVLEKQSSLLSFGTGYTKHFVPKGENWGALSWLFHLNHKKEETIDPLMTVLFDVQEQLPSELCHLVMGEDFQKIDLELKEAIGLDDTSKVAALIQEASDFPKQQSQQWSEIVHWTKMHFV